MWLLTLLPKLKLFGAILVVSALASSGGTWWLTSTYKDASWRASVMKQEIEASKVLRDALTRAIQAERDNGIYSARLETQHYEHTRQQEEFGRRNRSLARELGGLRDPGRRTSGQCPVPSENASAGVAPEKTAGVRLSSELQQFLFTVEDAGAALEEYAMTCYQYANQIPLAPLDEGVDTAPLE